MVSALAVTPMFAFMFVTVEGFLASGPLKLDDSDMLLFSDEVDEWNLALEKGFMVCVLSWWSFSEMEMPIRIYSIRSKIFPDEIQ